MNIQVEFFRENFVEAIGAGIYKISVVKDGKSKLLYIGESVFVLVRCATHLYELKKAPEYFGFDEQTIEDASILVRFELVKTIADTKLRKHEEKELIRILSPAMQNGISDRMKSVEDKIKVLTEFLNE